MGFLDRFINRNKPQEVVNNIPKEKEQMRKTFGVYCKKHHNTNGEKLCAKCTALLSTVMIKINRCPYGITKPICDKCEIMCFGNQKNKEFMEVMSSATSAGMFFKHPVTAFKHKMSAVGVDYGRQKMEDDKRKRAEAKEKNAKEKAKAKEQAEKDKK